MIFINTRPTQRAQPLTDFLQSQGVSVLELPLLKLVACELGEQEKHYLTQLNDYHALIFISETAVTYFFDFIKKHQISLNANLTFIAVGQKTAETFTQLWQTLGQNLYPNSPNLITPSDFNLPENNEGLLQLPFIKNLKKDDKILILKGKDGRELLKNTLLAKGVIVDKVDFYQRILPSTATQIFQNIYPNLPKKTIVLITSLTAWENWQDLIQHQCSPSDFDCKDFAYVVLQQRIANHLQNHLHANSSIRVIDDLQPITIFYAIQRLKEA